MTGLAPGTQVGRYRIERLLGEGGMAQVYCVVHETLGTRHALKVLTRGGETVRTRLIQEGQVQASLAHPNVVAVTDVLEVAGQPALLMEFIDGPTLETWLWERQHIDLPEAERLFAAILDAVHAAHARGLVHRDLKPGNILMDGATPKVTDFGLALIRTEGPRATRTGSTMGTPAYMAPEQIRDTKSVDQRADIFALGAILYELVSGHRAFEGDDVLELMNAVAKGAYRPVRTWAPGLPPRLEAAIDGALQVDPLDRIPNTAALRSVVGGDRLPQATTVLRSPPVTTTQPHPPAGPASIHTIDLAGHEDDEDDDSDEIPKSPRARLRLVKAGLVGMVFALGAVGVGALLTWEPDEPVQPVVIERKVPVEVPVVVERQVPVEVPVERVVPVPVVREVVPLREVPPSEVPPSEGPPSEGPPSDGAQLSAEASKTAEPREVVEAPAAVAPARVRVTGATLKLTGPDGVFPAGSVPPGTYSVQAVFDGRAVPAGSLVVRAGQTVVFVCDPDFMTCDRG